MDNIKAESLCQECEKEMTVARYCKKCNAEFWEKWEIEEADNLKEIKRLQENGHSQHCACRIVWGDGECECELYQHGGMLLKKGRKDIPNNEE